MCTAEVEIQDERRKSCRLPSWKVAVRIEDPEERGVARIISVKSNQY